MEKYLIVKVTVFSYQHMSIEEKNILGDYLYKMFKGQVPDNMRLPDYWWNDVSTGTGYDKAGDYLFYFFPYSKLIKKNFDEMTVIGFR